MYYSNMIVLVLVEGIADRMAHCVGDCMEAFIRPLDNIFLNCNEQNLLRCNVLTIWDKLVDVRVRLDDTIGSFVAAEKKG